MAIRLPAVEQCLGNWLRQAGPYGFQSLAQLFGEMLNCSVQGISAAELEKLAPDFQDPRLRLVGIGLKEALPALLREVYEFLAQHEL
mmetsp:Transcript_105749/g.188112  ORF Transcript_105749/g.188112 Transcript_105749/m.188112 type:complete len:87 (-) Transcript_105749:136-396(-)